MRNFDDDEEKRSRAKARIIKNSKVTTGDCWEWQKCLTWNGYADTHYCGKHTNGHRLSYHVFVGEIGDMFVLHKCDNRKCVNPDHLFLGTHQDNIADMMEKGRRGVTWNKGMSVETSEKFRKNIERAKLVRNNNSISRNRDVYNMRKYYGWNHHESAEHWGFSHWTSRDKCRSWRKHLASLGIETTWRDDLCVISF